MLTDKLNSFRAELLAAHGSVAAEAAAAAGMSPSASGTSTPTPAAAGSSSSAPAPAPPAAKAATPAPAPKEEKKKVGGTAVVQAEANLQASADDIWGLLTDQNRIPMWSRSPAKVGETRPLHCSDGAPPRATPNQDRNYQFELVPCCLDLARCRDQNDRSGLFQSLVP